MNDKKVEKKILNYISKNRFMYSYASAIASWDSIMEMYVRAYKIIGEEKLWFSEPIFFASLKNACEAIYHINNKNRPPQWIYDRIIFVENIKAFISEFSKIGEKRVVAGNEEWAYNEESFDNFRKRVKGDLKFLPRETNELCFEKPLYRVARTILDGRNLSILERDYFIVLGHLDTQFIEHNEDIDIRSHKCKKFRESVCLDFSNNPPKNTELNFQST